MCNEKPNLKTGYDLLQASRPKCANPLLRNLIHVLMTARSPNLHNGGLFLKWLLLKFLIKTSIEMCNRKNYIVIKIPIIIINKK